jgi:hypothetical protein
MSAKFRLEHAVVFCLVATETKITNFENEVLSEKQVLRLEIAMYEPLLVHMVESVHQLSKVRSGDFL